MVREAGTITNEMPHELSDLIHAVEVLEKAKRFGFHKLKSRNACLLDAIDFVKRADVPELLETRDLAVLPIENALKGYDSEARINHALLSLNRGIKALSPAPPR